MTGSKEDLELIRLTVPVQISEVESQLLIKQNKFPLVMMITLREILDQGSYI